MSQIYAAADLVVSRAGMSTLTELSVLAKPAILIPLPRTHQEHNAIEFYRKNAALALEQDNLDADKFSKAIKEILLDINKQDFLSKNIAQMMPRDAGLNVVRLLYANQ